MIKKTIFFSKNFYLNLKNISNMLVCTKLSKHTKGNRSINHYKARTLWSHSTYTVQTKNKFVKKQNFLVQKTNKFDPFESIITNGRFDFQEVELEFKLIAINSIFILVFNFLS